MALFKARNTKILTKILSFYIIPIMKREFQKSAGLLNLGEKEIKTIEILKNDSHLRPIDIARKTGIGRTTINFLLKKLQKRGIATHEKINQHYEWKLAETPKIKYGIENLYDLFGIAPAGGRINLPRDIGIELFKGKEQTFRAYEKFIKTTANRRLFGIQGNKALKDSLKFFPLSYIKNIQEWYRGHNFILEGIVGENSIELLKQLTPKELKAYQNRLTIIYVINDEYIDFDMDIFIVGATVVMWNYQKSILLIIKNKEICDAILNMAETMKAMAKKIDLNKFIKDLIEK